MNDHFSIQVKGVVYSKSEIIDLCNNAVLDNTSQEWEKGIYQFILDWISPSEYMMVSTSGSTGVPSKVKLLKKHMITSAAATIKHFNLEPGQRVWLCLPIDYIAAKMVVVRALTGGLELLITKPVSSPDLAENINIDMVSMVPNQVYKLSEENKNIFQNIKILLIGGSHIDSNLEEKLRNLSNIEVWHSYGMTETITHIALRKISKSNDDKKFYPLEGVEVTGNESGNIIIDYPAIGVNSMATNDIGKVDSDGSFEIIGRSDNVIVSGGKKFHPEIIEDKIQNIIPYEFIISSTKDSQMGENIILIVESNANIDTAENLFVSLKGKLERHEMPKKIFYLKNFVRTSNGKINRHQTTLIATGTS